MKVKKFLKYTSSMMVLSLTAVFNIASIKSSNVVVGADTIMEEVEAHQHTWSHDDAIKLTAGGTLNGGNYYLDSDVELDTKITTKNEVNICLNGHTLKGTGTDSVITINSGTLNLYDNGNGKITGGNSTGGGVYGSYGTFNMYGGTISGNTAYNGGGVFVTNISTFNMYGGKISDNVASSDGGGVFVNGGATFNMSDEAIISNNTAEENGGGVYVNNSSSEFNFAGGKIIGNAANCGGGVYVKDGPFKISGNLNITENNTGGNVYLKSNRVIEIVDQLDDGTKIGVTLANGSGIFTSGLLDNGEKNNFFSDDEAKCVWENDDELELNAHILSQPSYDGEDLHEPTCTENGLARTHCINDCGYYEDVSVDSLPHTYQHVEAKDATYTESGWKEHYYCEECNNYFLAQDGIIVDYNEDIVIDMLVHSYQHVEAKSATCTEDGWEEHYYCDECDNYFLAQDGVVVDYDEIMISALGHSYQHVDGKDATCTEGGWKEHYYCEECEKYFLAEDGVVVNYDEDIAIAPLSHTYQHVEAKDPTCTEGGWKEHYYCEECDKYFLAQDGVVVDYDEDIAIAALGHDFSTKWSTSSDKHWHECSRCDEIFEENEHSWNDGEIIKHPTQTETGEKEFTCTMCGYTKTEEIPATGNQGEDTPSIPGNSSGQTSGNQQDDNEPTNVVGVVFFAVLLVSIFGTCVYMIYMLATNKKNR